MNIIDVIERKPSNEGINSIGLKRAKRKQKAHNGDYYDRPVNKPVKLCTNIITHVSLMSKVTIDSTFIKNK